jgi:hypothetical protein
VLGHDHDGFRLCSLLLKRACTVDECAMLLELPAAAVRDFIHAAYLCGYAQLQAAPATLMMVQVAPAPTTACSPACGGTCAGASAMREHKVVVLGGMGSGKSTLVRSIAAGAVVDTDVANSDRLGADKASTTVALDYADIDLPNGDACVCTARRPAAFRFPVADPAAGRAWRGAAAGCAPRGRASELEAICRCCGRSHHPGAGGGGHPPDQAPHAALDDWAARACLDDQPLPLLAVDARDREQGLLLMDVLMSEMEAHALVAAHG